MSIMMSTEQLPACQPSFTCALGRRQYYRVCSSMFGWPWGFLVNLGGRET